MTSITQSSTRLVALVAGIAVAMSLLVGAFTAAPAQAAALTQSQISSIISLLQSFGADSATIANVQASLNGQPTSGTGGSTGGSASCSVSWTQDLQQGSTGSAVLALQKILNMWSDTQVAVSGAGSPGNETTTFGPATKAAVMKFQTKYGITPVAGYFGALSRAKLATICSGSSNGGGSTTPTGPGLSVSAATQPANALAPSGAARVPFTTFTLTNNTGTQVTVSSVTVQRVGFGIDANFSGIVLLDQNGLQVGISHTLNSNHQANIGDNFTINAGQSVTYTVAGNIATGQSTSGQIVSLQVVAINSSAPISGSLPINGASHTINTNLTLGSVSTSTSSFDPGTTQTKSIGDTGVRFSGVRFQANSAEDLRLYSIRWRQVGTASSVDIGNITSVINGTTYPTVLDASGRYYTSTFPGGILIPKGNSVDAYIQGDITGSNASSRNVQFNIDKNTDVYFVGQTYGYGIAVSGSYSPWFNGFVTTIQGGTATVIQNATSIASANVPVNVNNTVLGGFQTNFSGEPVTVSGLTFTNSTSSANYPVLTSVSLVNENGAVVAGPVDQTSNSTSITFGDSVTFPTGLHTWTLKGKVTSSAANGSTIQLSTVANSTNWVNATGQTTGNTVSLPGTSVSMNTQTVKGAILTVTASPTPTAQSIVSGTGVTLANIQVDASQSGEDIRLNNLPLAFTGVSGVTSALNTCQLWNGATSLNNGSNVINSVVNDGGTAGTYSSGNPTTFTFDNSLVVPKGTVLTLSLKCNIASSANGAQAVGVYSGFTYSALGVQSGNSLSATALSVTTGFSGIQTVSSTGGTFTAAVDSSSPSYTLVAAGTTGVTVGVVRLHASSENVNLTKLGLSLIASTNAPVGSGNSASTASGGTTNKGVNDLTQVYIYNGATQVGTLTFTGTGATATSSLTTPVLLTKDTDVLLTIKADLAQIGASAAGGIGDVVKVDPLNAEGSGVNSGQTVKVNATAGVAGIQMFKSFPTFAQGPAVASNPNGTAQALKKFSITANGAGPISIYQIAVSLATTSASVSNLQLFAYSGNDYASGPANVPNGLGSGQFGGTAALNSAIDIANPTVSFIQTTPLSFTGTLYFVLKGTVAPGALANQWTVNATVNGDNASTTAVAGTNANIATAVGRAQNNGLGVATSTGNRNFVWSDNASTTPTINDVDWFDGFFVPGLSSSGF